MSARLWALDGVLVVDVLLLNLHHGAIRPVLCEVKR